MKTTAMIAILALCSAGAAQSAPAAQAPLAHEQQQPHIDTRNAAAQGPAGNVMDVDGGDFPSGAEPESHLSRVEVKAELASARKDGTLEVVDDDYPELPQAASSKTRAQVRAETTAYLHSPLKNSMDALYRN